MEPLSDPQPARRPILLALQYLTQLSVAGAILLGGLRRLLAQGPRARAGEDVEVDSLEPGKLVLFICNSKH